MDVIERRRDLLDQMLTLKPGEQLKLTFESPKEAQNYRYNLYATLTTIRENPKYAEGIYTRLPGEFKISWKRKKEPSYLYITRRTNAEIQKVEILEAKKELPLFLQRPENTHSFMLEITNGSGFIMVHSAHKLTAPDLELMWELNKSDFNAYGKREAVFIGTEEDGEGVDTDTWILKETD